MKLLSSLLVAATQAANLCAGPLLSAVCDVTTGFTITVDETCRAASYSFVDWNAAFVNGVITVTDYNTGTDDGTGTNDGTNVETACQADGTGTDWKFVTAFNKCGVVAPTAAGTPDANGIAWYEYDLYLNFDSAVNTANGAGNIQQLGQTKITCKIPANFQENGAGVVTLTDPDIIEDLSQEVTLWDQLSLKIDKGGTAATAAWTGSDLGATPTIDLGEHVKLYVDLGTATTYNVAIKDCWASSQQNIRDNVAGTGTADGTDDDDGIINFDATGDAAGTPYSTVKFLANQCPVYSWVTNDAAVTNHATNDANLEVFLRQFAFKQDGDDDPTTGDFWYHCEVSVCLPGADCVPDPACTAPATFNPTGRRRRAILSRRVARADSTELVSDKKVNVNDQNCAEILLENNIATCRKQKSAGSSAATCSAALLTSAVAWWLH